VKLLTLIFRVPLTEVIVQSKEQVDQSYPIVWELADRHCVLDINAKSFVKAGHSSPFVLGYLRCEPRELG
jgi:hypothetical protein